MIFISLRCRFGCLVFGWGLAEMLNCWKWAEVIHTQLAACNSSGGAADGSGILMTSKCKE